MQHPEIRITQWVIGYKPLNIWVVIHLGLESSSNFWFLLKDLENHQCQFKIIPLYFKVLQLFFFFLHLFIQQTLLSKATSKREIYKSAQVTDHNNEISPTLQVVKHESYIVKNPKISAKGKNHKSMKLNKLQLDNI